MQKPMKGHLELINQILRYLKPTLGRGILMQNHDHVNIVGYSNADWAGNPLDRKPTTGFCMFVGGNVVTWKRKKQSVVARSSAEAEYQAMATATSEITWLMLLLKELGHDPNEKPTTLFCNNQVVIHIATNHVYHERTKYIEVDCYFVREKILNKKIIETAYIRSNDQLANILTKPLNKGVFEALRDKLTFDGLYEST
jgi:hypothetical protein